MHKIGIVSKESAETQYWLELFKAIDLSDKEELNWLYKESTELLAIFTSIGKSAKSGKKAINLENRSRK